MTGRVLLLLSAAYGAWQWCARTAGATAVERSRAMPGDAVVPTPQITVTRATTLPAPPEEVWPWIVQMGWGRAGWYTARLVDRVLFPANAPSAWRILPEHQSLAVGDRVPDGPPESECWFTVVDLRPERCLVLRSQRHLPLSWRRAHRAALDWTWAFTLSPTEQGASTRLVFRWRAHTSPAWLTFLARALVVPADHVMSRSMFHGLRERVVTASAPSGTPRSPVRELGPSAR